jgi:hypothetical protein
MTQPHYWLATDPTTKTRQRKQRKTEREKNRERLRTSGLTGSSPLTRPEAKSF